MRILAISHLFPHTAEPRYGIFVARQLQAMSKCGAEIELLVPRPYRPRGLLRLLGKSEHMTHDSVLLDLAPGINAKQCVYPSVPGAWFNSYAGFMATRAVRQEAARLHEEQPFDVIYATNVYLGGDIGWRLGKALGIPSVCLAIGEDVNKLPKLSAKLGARFELIVKNSSGLIACGESLADVINKHREDTCPAIYGVVDLESFKPMETGRDQLRVTLGLPTDKTILLYAGYLWKRKGLVELIHAFDRAIVCNPDAFLVVCGAGDEENVIREAAARTSRPELIRFAGAVAPDEIHNFMRASDAFVLPSYDEGMPNAVMEAMACGLPVVATHVGGLTAALENCPGAILVPPKETEPLSEALELVLSSSELRTEMGRAARTKAESSFGAIPNAQRIVDFLSDVAGRL